MLKFKSEKASSLGTIRNRGHSEGLHKSALSSKGRMAALHNHLNQKNIFAASNSTGSRNRRSHRLGGHTLHTRSVRMRGPLSGAASALFYLLGSWRSTFLVVDGPFFLLSFLASAAYQHSALSPREQEQRRPFPRALERSRDRTGRDSPAK